MAAEVWAALFDADVVVSFGAPEADRCVPAMTGAAAVELAGRQTPHARGAGAGGALAGATSFAAGAAVVDATVAGGSEAVVAADKAAWVCGLLACAIVACAAGAGAFFDENGAASARPHRRSC